jgi:regulatory protein
MNAAAGCIGEGFKTTLAKARQWCAAEERCPQDIRIKLMKLNCPQSDIDSIIDQLSEEGFINEQRYVRAYVSGKFNISKWGKIKIASGLRMKKIPERFISDALNEIDQDEYRNCLIRLLKNKQKELKNGPAPEIKFKLARFALQKGFEREMVFNQLGTKEE